MYAMRSIAMNTTLLLEHGTQAQRSAEELCRKAILELRALAAEIPGADTPDVPKARQVTPTSCRDMAAVHRQRVLRRILDAVIVSAMGRALSHWVTFCSVDTAIVPMEDELFIAQRELRRAQALVESLTHGGGACSAL
jgi:hypothetical protein